MSSLRLVYPKPEQAIYEESTFLIGSVPAGCRLTLNEEPVDVSPQGFFGWPVSLHFGDNHLALVVLEADGQTREQETLTVYREAPFKRLSPETPRLHPETILPQYHLTLMPGDALEVACMASPDSQVFLHIPAVLDEPVPLHRYQGTRDYVDNRQTIYAQWHQNQPLIPAEGHYSACVHLPPTLPEIAHAPMTLEVTTANGNSESHTLEATLTVWHHPRWAVVRAEEALLRTEPVDGARLTPQQAGCWLQVDGIRQGWARIRLSSQRHAWISLADIQLEDSPSFLPPSASLDWVLAGGHRLMIGTRHSRPILIEMKENCLCVHLFDVVNRCDFIYQKDHQCIEGVTWHQAMDQTVELRVSLAEPERLAGYTCQWQTSSGWEIHLNLLPPDWQDTRIVIDPGHGGEETGATGPDGQPEKALNLMVASKLARALMATGFRNVVMTRREDLDVALSERTKRIQDEKAHVVLSIHHNALPDGRDPREYQGASAYYYHSFARPLACAMQQAMAETGAPDFGLFYDSLHMTRIHDAQAVLLELGFFTQPEEYERLIDPAWQDRVANSLTDGLKRYLQHS